MSCELCSGCGAKIGDGGRGEKGSVSGCLMPSRRCLACGKAGDFPAESAGTGDAQNGFCCIGGIAEQSPAPRHGPAAGDKDRRTLRAFLEWIISHSVLTLVLILLLLLLVVALMVSLAVGSARACAEAPVTPGAPLVPPCPWDWIGHRGGCYHLSRDERSWEQGQDRCSELGASLAVLSDEEMEFLFHFTQNTDFWIGLRHRDERLQWGDGSTYNSSSVPVLGNAECVFLAESKLRRTTCSSRIRYLCSKARTAPAQK